MRALCIVIVLLAATAHAQHLRVSGTRVVVVNDGSESLSFWTYDGGYLHNGIERWDGSAWIDAAPGYCGLGFDEAITVVEPGHRTRVHAHFPTTPGTYRLTLTVQRGGRSITIHSRRFRR